MAGSCQQYLVICLLWIARWGTAHAGPPNKRNGRGVGSSLSAAHAAGHAGEVCECVREAWVQGVVLPTGPGGWHMSGRPGARVACALRLQGYACTPKGTRAWCAGDTCPGDIGPLCVWLGRGAAQGRRALTKGKAVHHTMHLTNAWIPVMCSFAPEMWGLGGTGGQLQGAGAPPSPSTTSRTQAVAGTHACAHCFVVVWRHTTSH